MNVMHLKVSGGAYRFTAFRTGPRSFSTPPYYIYIYMCMVQRRPALKGRNTPERFPLEQVNTVGQRKRSF